MYTSLCHFKIIAEQPGITFWPKSQFTKLTYPVSDRESAHPPNAIARTYDIKQPSQLTHYPVLPLCRSTFIFSKIAFTLSLIHI